MQRLKTAGVFVVILLSLFFAIPLLLPDTFKVEKRIYIERPPLFVFTEVRDYQTWIRWSPWTDLEPTATYTYKGSPGNTGFEMGWAGELIGEGTLTLTYILEPLRLEGVAEFKRPPLPRAKDIWIFDEKDTGTDLRWIVTGELGYPQERYLGVFINTQLGAKMESGLKNLKSYLESSAPLSVPLNNSFEDGQ